MLHVFALCFTALVSCQALGPERPRASSTQRSVHSERRADARADAWTAVQVEHLTDVHQDVARSARVAREALGRDAEAAQRRARETGSDELSRSAARARAHKRPQPRSRPRFARSGDDRRGPPGARDAGTRPEERFDRALPARPFAPRGRPFEGRFDDRIDDEFDGPHDQRRPAPPFRAKGLRSRRSGPEDATGDRREDRAPREFLCPPPRHRRERAGAHGPREEGGARPFAPRDRDEMQRPPRAGTSGPHEFTRA